MSSPLQFLLLVVSSCSLETIAGGLHGKTVYVRDVSLQSPTKRKSGGATSLPPLVPPTERRFGEAASLPPLVPPTERLSWEAASLPPLVPPTERRSGEAASLPPLVPPTERRSEEAASLPPLVPPTERRSGDAASLPPLVPPTERRSGEAASLSPLVPIKLETQDGEEAIHLLLQRNTRIPTDLLVTFDKEEFNNRPVPSLKDTGFYHDYATGAALTVDNNGPTRAYRGIFQHEKEVYAIRPVETGSESGRPNRGMDDHGAHVVERISSEGILDYGNDMPELPRSFQGRGHSTRSTLSGNKYEVELLMYLDYTIYEFWKEYLGDHDSAVKQIKKEYTSHINAMDLSYELISRDGYDVNVRIIPWGLHIITSNYESPWTVDTLIGYKNPYYGARDMVINADKALNMMRPTIYQIGAASGSWPDHLMLWTQHDLGSSMDATALLGLAYPEGVCTIYEPDKTGSGVSIIEDIGQMVWKTATHELGHSLGMFHDDAEGCGSDHIMSSALLSPKTQDLNLRFSKCSVERMIEVFKGIGRSYSKKPKTCLQETDCSKRVYLTGADYKFGEQWSMDKYCQMYNNGEDYKACTEKDADRLCLELSCYRDDDVDKSTCGSSTKMWTIPGDGTPCGDGMWCIKGQCLKKSETEQHNLNEVACSDGSTPDRGHQDNEEISCYDRMDCSNIDRNFCSDSLSRDYWCCTSCKAL